MRASIKAGCRTDGRAAHRWSFRVLSYLALILLACAPTNALASEFEAADDEGATEAEAGQWRTVARAIGGDTIVLDGGERIRLIGVDTPETVHPQKPVEYFGKEASGFTRRMVEGKRVRLEYEQGASRTDRYGRTLPTSTWRTAGSGTSRSSPGGSGHAYTRYPFSKMEEFRAGERKAREAGKGLWAGAHTTTGSLPAEQPGVDSGLEATSGSCIPRDQCCKICRKGQECGNSCISRSYTCRKGRRCACDAVEVCR